VIERWRRLALWLLLFGIVGILLELLLLEHYEDAPQWAPLALLTAGLVVGSVVAVRPGRAALRTLRVLMVAFVASAGAGMFFHLKANVEFELELRPSMAGTELVLETLKGAMPALAPGAMAQLGLLGLLVTYGHPLLRQTPPAEPRPDEGPDR